MNIPRYGVTTEIERKASQPGGWSQGSF